MSKRKTISQKNSFFFSQNYAHPDEHTRQMTDIPGFKEFTTEVCCFAIHGSAAVTYFLASDDGGLLGTSGLSKANSSVINVRDSKYCCAQEKKKVIL